MTKDSMDIAIDSKHCTPCSSSHFEKVPFAASDSVSGWDELIHHYQRHVKHRKALSSRYGLKSKQRSRNSTERDSVCSAVKTTVDSRCADGNPITCPVCSYVVTWRSSLNDVPVETLILKHIQSHEGEVAVKKLGYVKWFVSQVLFEGIIHLRICSLCMFCVPFWSKGDSTIGERPILRQAAENYKFFEGSSQKSTDHPTTGLPSTSDGEESAFNVTTHSVKSYGINWKPSSLNGCLMENSACENGSDVGEFEEYVPHFGGHTVPTGFGQPIMEDKSSIVASTCSLEPTSAIDLTSGISNSGELECCEESSDSNPSNVELHKLAVRKKFLWSGSPPPPLSKDQTEQLAKLSRSECPFCKAVRGGRGLRIPGSFSDEIKEECMIAHIVKFHHNDPSAAWVLNAKRYRMSVDDGLNPLKFLLEPTKDGSLRCSSCERAAFPKISNLRLHWATCIAVCGRYRDGLRRGRCVLVSPSAAAIKTKKSRSVNEGKNEHLADEFPFLHVSKSFMNSVERGGVLNLQCAKCDRNFPTPNELVQHAKRYHPTEEHYSKFEFVMEKEFVFKFDVLKSLRFSLEKGAAHILCLPCSELFEYSKYLYHRKRGVCGDANKISEAVPCSLKNRKVKVSYVRLRGSGCSNSRRQVKRSYR
uniref:C2H2-type domain-containing protein n=1 Tax=Angiostrongylus cantonensis TaxID=6313 RepID=A0A0K0DNV1_ANGCA